MTQDPRGERQEDIQSMTRAYAQGSGGVPAPASTVIAQIPLLRANPRQAVEYAIEAVLDDRAARFHFVNAYTAALAANDPAYHRVLMTSTGNFADGRPLQWVARARRVADLHQVRGPWFFEKLLDEGRARGLRHYLLGSAPETLAVLASEIKRKYPGCEIVGTFSPPFRPMTDAERDDQDRQISKSSPHIVWVGLGTPKQDVECARLAEANQVTTIAVGAAFDFSAGRKRVAPLWLSKAGLEWAFRFATEPRRLWRRYTTGNLQFASVVFRESLRMRRTR